MTEHSLQSKLILKSVTEQGRYEIMAITGLMYNKSVTRSKTGQNNPVYIEAKQDEYAVQIMCPFDKQCHTHTNT